MKETIEYINPLIFDDDISGRLFYQSQPKQSEFHAAIANRHITGIDEFLFGGSAGPGKSYALRWEGHNQCIHYPRVRGLLMRSSYPELERTHIAKVRFDFPAGVLTYNETKHKATYYNDSVLEFGYGESPKDFVKYLSAEYDFILYDELTTIPFELYLLMKSRVRTSIAGYHTFIAGATNPGGPSHRHVRSYFINKDFREEYEEMASEYRPETIQYIHATVYDNQILLRNDPKYISKLKSLPPFERKRFLEGSWDISEGQFFKKWTRDVHVIKVSPDFKIPKHWEKVIGLDYGNVFTAIALAKDKFNNILAFLEFTAPEGKEATEKAKLFKTWLTDNGLLEVPIFADVTVFAKQKEFSGENSYKYFLREEVYMHPVSKKSLDEGAKFRLYCNRIMKDLLYWETDDAGIMVRRPKFFCIDGKVKKLPNTLPELQTDENDDEQISNDSKHLLHWYDAAKYGIISFGKHVPITPEKKEELKRRFQAYAQS